MPYVGETMSRDVVADVISGRADMEKIEKLKNALKKYGTHKVGCHKKCCGRCDCGLDSALGVK